MKIVYNWHITEVCNYSCHYCFAKWDRPPEIWKDNVKSLTILKEIQTHGHLAFPSYKTSDPIRINFAGGEPLLLKNKLLSMIKAAKDCGFKVSIITNASLSTQLIKIANDVDMIGISVDSLNFDTNELIGRCTTSKKSLAFDDLVKLTSLLREENDDINIKFNIVINKHNYKEQIINRLQLLAPYKIKVFRELSAGKNISTTSDFMFQHFIEINESKNPNVFIEDNDTMTESYLMIDPQGRLYQNGGDGMYNFSEPIHEVGLKKALESIRFNQSTFKTRYEGLYNEK